MAHGFLNLYIPTLTLLKVCNDNWVELENMSKRKIRFSLHIDVQRTQTQKILCTGLGYALFRSLCIKSCTTQLNIHQGVRSVIKVCRIYDTSIDLLLAWYDRVSSCTCVFWAPGTLIRLGVCDTSDSSWSDSLASFFL